MRTNASVTKFPVATLFRELLLWGTASVFFTVSLGVQLVRAELVPTAALIEESSPREHVLAVLAREDISAGLTAYGVSAREVEDRISVMSDDEVADLAAQLDAGIAGGDGLGAVVGAVVFIFVLLLITDIIGFTKVFPFTRSLR